MNVEEKKARKFEFIRKRFTESAFTELALFDRNAQSLVNVVRLEMMVHDKLERKEIETGLSDELLLEVKQFLYIDALAKIMMLIEGLLAMSDAISDPGKGYAKISEAMISYRDPSILKFISRFRAKQVDLWKLAGLPALEKLPITAQEAADLKVAFQESVTIFEEFLTIVVNFYECNMIPYNKFKHGLSLIAGMQLKDPQQRTVAHVLTALERTRKGRVPSCTCYQTTERLVPPDIGWFNTLCFVPSPQREKYESIINSLLSAISFIAGNHILYALNCGEDYFPLKMGPDGTPVPFLLLPKNSLFLAEYGKKQIEPIIKKVVANTNYSQKTTINFIVTITDEKMRKILECFREHASALIWSSEAASGSATVTVTS